MVEMKERWKMRCARVAALKAKGENQSEREVYLKHLRLVDKKHYLEPPRWMLTSSWLQDVSNVGYTGACSS